MNLFRCLVLLSSLFLFHWVRAIVDDLNGSSSGDGTTAILSKGSSLMMSREVDVRIPDLEVEVKVARA